jgi:hypothetical protein
MQDTLRDALERLKQEERSLLLADDSTLDAHKKQIRAELIRTLKNTLQ